MRKEVLSYVQACEICEHAKVDLTKSAGLLQTLPIPEQIWEDVAMDFIDGLPQVRRHIVKMVVVDWLTKSAHFSVQAHPYTAKKVT